MKKKPQCFQNSIKTRKNIQNDYKKVKQSPNIQFLSNKPFLENKVRIRDNVQKKSTICQNSYSRYKCYSELNAQHDDIHFKQNIPQLLAKFASQNQQLVKQRHSLFQKNCQLVNKIRQFETGEKMTKIKSLKCLGMPKQQVTVGYQDNTISPRLQNKNFNRTHNQKKSQAWLFDSFKDQSNDKIFHKKSPDCFFNDINDMNTTKKKLQIKSGRQNLYRITDMIDPFNSQNTFATQPKQSQNCVQTDKQKSLSKFKSQKKSQKSNYKIQEIIFPQHYADKQQQICSKPFQQIKTHRPQLKKSATNLSCRDSNNKFKNYEQMINPFQRIIQQPNISFQTDKQLQAPLLPSPQNIIKKTSLNWTQPLKSKRIHTQNIATKDLQHKLLKIKQQNNKLRKQLCYLK